MVIHCQKNVFKQYLLGAILSKSFESVGKLDLYEHEWVKST